MIEIKSFTYKNSIPCVHITNTPKINLFKTFDCGQSFRFDPVSLGESKYEFGGVAHGKYVIFAQDNENEIKIYNSTREEYFSLWEKYLSLDLDYEKIHKEIKDACPLPYIDEIIATSSGIRILRQERWESLCSFIISQNNNIPRIKKIISSLCEKYGESVYFGGEKHYAFPTSKSLYEAGEDEIFALKTGFRAKYIFDASKRVSSGELSLDMVYSMPSFDDALKLLCTVKGVGPKVASCALLFGFERGEAFPIDVHMKRTLKKHFPNGLDISSFGKNAGLVQQYLFYNEKYLQNT